MVDLSNLLNKLSTDNWVSNSWRVERQRSSTRRNNIEQPEIESISEPEVELEQSKVVSDSLRLGKVQLEPEDFQVPAFWRQRGNFCGSLLMNWWNYSSWRAKPFNCGLYAGNLGCKLGESQLDVVGTAKWVMSEKLTKWWIQENYQYMIMLGRKLVRACRTPGLKGAKLLIKDNCIGGEVAGKRPWLAEGVIKKKMCALIPRRSINRHAKRRG